MPVMDEFREEREALKHGTPKERFHYFLDYYKWHVVAAVLVTAFVGSLMYQTLTQKERALYAVLVNAREQEPAQDYPQAFAEYAGIDTGESEILFDSSLYLAPSGTAAYDENTVANAQKLLVYIAAQEIDALIAGESVITSYAYNGTFHDLSTILSEEQFAKYEPYFYYIDQSIAEALSERDADSGEFVGIPDYPSSKSPESMENPVPVGIYLDAAGGLKEAYAFTDETSILCVPAGTKHLENAVKYLDFIFEPAIPAAGR